MAEKVKKEKRVKGTSGIGKRGKSSLPVKRSINLVSVGKKPINVKLAIPGIILIILGAGLLSKFAVADRLLAMYRAQGAAANAQRELDSAYEQLNSYGDLLDRYAHYTYSGMTEEELSRVDRTKIVDLIQRIIIPEAALGAWSVTGNELSVNFTGNSLQEINLIVQKLEADPLVDFCKVTTAVMDDKRADNTGTVQQTNPSLIETVPTNGDSQSGSGTLGTLANDLAARREALESTGDENSTTQSGTGTTSGGTSVNGTADGSGSLSSAPVTANVVVYLSNTEEADAE